MSDHPKLGKKSLLYRYTVTKMLSDWPPSGANDFGIAILSLGNWREHRLEPRLEAAAKAGYKWIDLFDECWAAYLEGNDYLEASYGRQHRRIYSLPDG